MATIIGSDGDDIIDATHSAPGQAFATNNNDTIYGNDGGDVIDGLGGNDVIVGGNGVDTINGGDGDDYLNPFGGTHLDALFLVTPADIVEGGTGIDTLVVDYAGQISQGLLQEYDVIVDITIGTERVKFELPIINTGSLKAVLFNSIEKLRFNGGAGNDFVTGGALDDHIFGGDGNDVIWGAGGDDILADGLGVLSIDGGDGIDVLSIDRGDEPDDLVFDANAGTMSIGGLSGSHIFNVEVISFRGGAGNDTITGLSTLPTGEVVTLRGFGGNDVITGGDGTEIIRGDAGDDTLIGGGGNDTLEGGDGIDEVFGGEGDDLFEVVHHPVAGETYDGGSGRDTFQISVGGGGVTDLTVASITGFEVMHNHNFGLVDDIFRMSGIQLSQFSEITLDAGSVVIELADNTTVAFAAGGVIDLEGIRLKDGGQSIDFSATLGTRMFQGLMGGDGDDVVTGPGYGGTPAYRTFKAFLGEGDDTFTASGGTGVSNVSGEAGDDALTGGAGDDTLNGGAGADALDGGGGINTVTYATDTAGVTVNLATQAASGGQATGDTIANFRNIIGGSGNDTLTGDSNDNVLEGQGGDDTIDGGGGNDTIRGDISFTGVGADTLRGGDGNDTIFGYAGNDILIGGDGDDTLSGDTSSTGAGQDILEGGAGNDTMTGGQANDTFVYDGQGADIITDFNGGPGVGDVIRVTGVYSTFAQIQANATLVNGGADTRIDFGGGNALTLRGFSGVLDLNDFSFDVVEPPPSGPEVTVTGNGVGIADNDASPDISDHTDFGTVGVGAIVTRTFTVENDGTAPLTVAKLKVPKGFKVSEGISSPIAAGESDTFTVTVDTKKAGLKSGQITFTTNDADEGAFNFALAADVVVLPPEIEVTGNGNLIGDDDLAPDVADGTDFGDVTVGSTVIQTFTVSNTGPGTLTISKLKAPKGFKVVDKLASSIASGESDTFSLQLDTKKVGLKTGQIVFATNDADEGAFNFALSGNVVAPAAPLRLDAAFGSETASLFGQADDQMPFHVGNLDISEPFPRNAMTDFDLA